MGDQNYQILGLQHMVIIAGMEDGLSLDEKLLPEYLKELGYATHLIGKQHLGHAREAYTPTFRGFDSHYGYWLGAHDYYDHFLMTRVIWRINEAITLIIMKLCVVICNSYFMT